MTMRRWCRAALVMTVVASATLGWTAGAGDARPRQCGRLINNTTSTMPSLLGRAGGLGRTGRCVGRVRAWWTGR